MKKYLKDVIYLSIIGVLLVVTLASVAMMKQDRKAFHDMMLSKKEIATNK